MELKLTNLTKRYGQKTALDDFTYTFHEGIYGILGANGAGKSTMMNLITDNVVRTAGEITPDGRVEIPRLLPRALQRRGLVNSRSRVWSQQMQEVCV